MAPILIGLVFLGIGLFFIYRFYDFLQQAKASTYWPSVWGKVVQSELERVRHASGRKSHSSVNKYKVHIRYSYTLGETYTGDNVAFGLQGLAHPYAKAKALSDLYPVGREVEVFYDPSAPQASVLEKGKTNYAMTGVVIGALLSMVGAGFCLGVLLK